MTWVEVEVLYEDGLDDLLCFLDLKQELSIAFYVVEDLSAQIFSKSVEQDGVFIFMKLVIRVTFNFLILVVTFRLIVRLVKL